MSSAYADLTYGYGNMDEGNEQMTSFVKFKITSPNLYSLQITVTGAYSTLMAIANMRLNYHSTLYGGDSQHCYDFMSMILIEIDRDTPSLYGGVGEVFLFNGFSRYYFKQLIF